MAKRKKPGKAKAKAAAPPPAVKRSTIVDPAEARRKAVTRRMFLSATGALALGATVLGYSKYTQWWNRPPGAGLEALSTEEYAVVQAMAEAWMPAGEPAPTLSGADADCGAFVDEVVSRMPQDQRQLFKLMLHVLDETPWVIERARYTQLDLTKRAQHLKAWFASPVFYHRQGVAAVTALISMAYTSHPEVAPVFDRWFGCGYGR